MLNHRIISLLSIATLVLAACQSEVKRSTPDFLAGTQDTTASPGADFFLYANGGWIKKTTIPEEESGWGIGQLVQQDIYTRLRKISETAAATAAPQGSVSQQIGDLWSSGMDSATIDKQGLQPLHEELELIHAIHNVDDLLRVAARSHRQGGGALFADWVAQDDKNSDLMAYQLGQGGLGMPNRDYYFNTDEKTVKVKAAYLHFMYLIFRRLGRDSAAAMAATNSVLQLETRLARSSRKLADLRDPNANYHKMPLAGVQKLTPLISWNAWLKNSGIGKTIDSVIVRQPEFYTALNTELEHTPVEEWKSYLEAHLVSDNAVYLDQQTFSDYFAYRQTLTGAKAPRPRWKRVLDAQESAMGEALGQLFVKEYFPEKAKQRYSDLVEAIRDAYKERIMKLSWMSDSTRQKALNKLAHVTKKVGYPDKWKDFSAMKIDRGPFVLNMQRAAEWWTNYTFSKLGKPVDRTEWNMSPQTYDAYYNPSNNEIVLPAGIFTVPGMKDEDLDDAFVYGYAAASTIGHELTHGFDDQGRQFDDKGNLLNWWQPADEKGFKDRAALIIRQFSEFNPVDTLHVNGDATQGENIADLGGLLLGLDAFARTEAYKKGEKIGGFTPLQRYFLGYAYSWLSLQRKEIMATQLLTDVHALPKERVNGPVVNIPAFYEAFGIHPGDKMYRPDSLRVNIW
ncbi:MAG TPA: M13 family metallopeptidase [Puia sp.]|nr:M13 family metallopeptidase [Puia sp.]